MASRVALITGSSSGIGLAIARQLVTKYNVVLTGLANDLMKQDISKAFNSIPNRKSFHFIEKDLVTEKGVYSLSDEVFKLYPDGVDILVNNAGIQHVAPIVDFPVSIWNQMMSIQLTAAFILIKQLMPGMLERGWGRIVNHSSTAGLVGMPGKIPYTVTKFGLIGMIKGAALEGARHGVTCNAVCPACVETPLVQEQIRDFAVEKGISFEDAWDEIVTTRMPSQKAITVEQVASLVEYLCTDDAAGITGAALSVDGGYTAQ